MYNDRCRASRINNIIRQITFTQDKVDYLSLFHRQHQQNFSSTIDSFSFISLSRDTCFIIHNS